VFYSEIFYRKASLIKYFVLKKQETYIKIYFFYSNVLKSRVIY